MKETIIEKAGMLLLKKGFAIKSLSRACFDIVARNESRILLIKALEDANSISKEYAEEMASIASYIKASPIVIAEKAGHELESNVVYMRFGIFTVNFNTFENAINNRFPFLISNPAGLTAIIRGDRLREIREEKGMSLTELGRRIGTSRKMIQKYEEGNTNITVANARKMLDIFTSDVFAKIDVFSERFPQKSFQTTDVSKKYSKLGFEASDTKKAPFDVIAKKGQEIVITEVGDVNDPRASSISRLVGARNLVIFRKKKPKEVPSLSKKEFMEYEKAAELIKFLKEFG